MHRRQNENLKSRQRGKRQIGIKGGAIRWTLDFLMKILKAKRLWNIVKVLKENIQMFKEQIHQSYANP